MAGIHSLYGDESGRARLTRDEALSEADLNADGHVTPQERLELGRAFDRLDRSDGESIDGVLDENDRLPPGHVEDLRLIESVGHRAFEHALKPRSDTEASLRLAGRTFHAVATLGQHSHPMDAARARINLGHILENESDRVRDRSAPEEALRLTALAEKQFMQAEVLASAVLERHRPREGEVADPRYDSAGALGWEASFYQQRMVQRAAGLVFGDTIAAASMLVEGSPLRCSLVGMNIALAHIEDRVEPSLVERSRTLLQQALDVEGEVPAERLAQEREHCTNPPG